MNIYPLINIDTVEFNVEGMKFNIPETTTAQVTTSDGEIIKSYQNRVAISGKYGIHTIHARTMHDGAKLFVEGSLYGFQYGQNIFTSPVLRPACVNALKTVCDMFNIKPSKELKKLWCAGDINLKHVDLAVLFKLKSEREVRQVLHQIARQFLESGYSIKKIGDTIYLTPRGGKEYEIAFYAKGPQMRIQKNIKLHPHFDQLRDECGSMLRVEVRLRCANSVYRKSMPGQKTPPIKCFQNT
jgi:II/X family phage/plasmid replication protein